MFRWITGLAVGVALLILAVGCGGGGDSSTEVTKAEFTKQANAICAEGRNERKADYTQYKEEVEESTAGGKPKPKVEKALADKMVKERMALSLEHQVGQLEDLGVPPPDEAQISKMVKSLVKGTGEASKGGFNGLLGSEGIASFLKEAEGYGLDCALF